MNLGVALRDLHRFDGALRQFKKALSIDTHDVGARITTFSATASLVAQLDLVMAADTAAAHLAGALGEPVWISQPFTPYRSPRTQHDGRAAAGLLAIAQHRLAR